MKIKKRWIVLGIIGLAITWIFLEDLFDNRPFKFENYKDSKQLEIALKNKFPAGTNMNDVKLILEESGAKCEDVSKDKNLPNVFKKYDRLYWCEYSTGWFSTYPLTSYTVVLYSNDKQKFEHLWTEVIRGFV